MSSYMHSSLHHETLRELQATQTQLSAANFMYPVFVISNDDEVQDIESMPQQKRFGGSALIKHLSPLVENGLKSILLFGIVEQQFKDEQGAYADCAENPVVQVLPRLRKQFPDLLLACDVCLCPYTKSGHCGILDKQNQLNNEASIQRLAEIATSYALAGAHIVAPSDMMDNRVQAIKQALVAKQLQGRVSVLSYAAKFASSFYGPFRDAAQSSPAFGDRRGYQLPAGSAAMGMRAVHRDVEQGADMLMVKPGMLYLDMLQRVKKEFPHHPLFVYQVSGEYCMLYYAAQHGAIQFDSALLESMIAFRRAGADCIITYFTPLLLDLIKKKN